MACATCGATVCRGDCAFTDPTVAELQQTLLAQFTPVVDNMRDLITQLGARAYKVSIVRTKWSGGLRNRGTELVYKETRILPTPLISDLTQVGQTTLPIGTQELGKIRVSEISGRYTENDLTGLSTPLEDDESIYWEIYFAQSDGSGVRRRFTLNSAPSYDAERLEWSAMLLRAAGDRLDDGSPA